MAFRNLAEEVEAIERAAIELAAKAYLNKAQLTSRISQTSAHLELPPVLLRLKAPYIVPKMPEEAFCYIVSVTDCIFHKQTQDCECSKTMIFGGNTEVCTRVTKRSTPSKCVENWSELKRECVIDSLRCEDVSAIERMAIKFSAKEHLNKAQLTNRISQAARHPALPPLLLYSQAARIIEPMQEALFCEIVSVSDCVFHSKDKSCEYSKTMLFGQTAEVCTRLKKPSTKAKCQDSCPELKKECVLESLISCDNTQTEASVEEYAPHDYAKLEAENICYKDRAKFLENALAKMISDLSGEVLEKVVKIIGKNMSSYLCDLL